MATISRYNYSKDEKDRLLEEAWAFSQLDMHTDATKSCEKLVKIDKNNPASYIELGYYYEQNGQIEEARQCYCNLMIRFPEYHASYTNMGHYFHVYKNRPDIALVCYEKALDLNPYDNWSLNNIGTILQEDGLWEEALAYYEQAYEASDKEDEKNYDIFRNLAWAYYRCKEYNKAWRLFDELINQKPLDSSIRAEFGCVNYKLGLYEKTLLLFKEALSMVPDSRYYARLCNIANRKVKNKGLLTIM